MKTVVLIPCYNESQTISKVVKDFKKELPHADIYVYDNNSTDDTAAIAEKAGAIVKHEFKQGKGNVVRSMFRDIDADCYILVDGDDTYPASGASKMEETILSGRADMVVGDRLSSTYFMENKRLFHNSGNKLVRNLINFFFKSDIKDIMSGLRAFNYDFVKSFPITSQEFEVETEMSIFALNHNFTIEEIPVNYKDRQEGSESKLNTFRDGYKVIKLIFAFVRDMRPLFFFSLISLVLVLIAAIYFFPVLFAYFRTGLVLKIPTLIVVVAVVIIAFIIFLSGVILHSLKQKDKKDFEHHLTLIRQNKKF